MTCPPRVGFHPAFVGLVALAAFLVAGHPGPPISLSLDPAEPATMVEAPAAIARAGEAVGRLPWLTPARWLQLAGALSAAATTGMVCALGHAVGAPGLVAALISLAYALLGATWGPATHAAAPVPSVLLAALALWLWIRVDAPGRWLAVGLLAVAAVDRPDALGLIPALGLALAVGHLPASSAGATLMTAAAVGAAGVSGSLAPLTAQVGPLVLALAVVGLKWSLEHRREVGLPLTLALIASMLASPAGSAPARSTSLVVVVMWPLVAGGVTALALRLTGWLRQALAVATSALIVLSTAPAALSHDHGLERLTDRFVEALTAALEPDGVLATDDPAIGALLSLRRRGHGPRLEPAVSERVAAHARRRRPVYTTGPARERFELQGHRFAPVAVEGFDTSLLPLFRLRASDICGPIVAPGWTDVSSLAVDGRLGGTLEGEGARLVVYVGRARPLRPRPTASVGVAEPIVRVEAFAPTRRSALAAALARDRVRLPGSASGRDHVYRVLVQGVAPAHVFGLELGGVPRWARATTVAAHRATLCAMPLTREPVLTNGSRSAIAPDHDTMFGDGWHPVENAGTPQSFRWTAKPESELLVRIGRREPLRVRVRARPSAPSDPDLGTITLGVNDRLLAARRLQVAPTWYEWQVGAEAVRVGVNQLVLHVPRLRVPSDVDSSADPRPLGVAVFGIEIARGG